MTTTTLQAPLALRPLALPNEHGGWGFLLEPILLGLAVAPASGGGLVALAFIFGFLCRQPLRLALQDAVRERTYPRTRWCWSFFAIYALCAITSLALAVLVSGWTVIIPIGLVAPMGLMQVLYDAHNRGRALLPELGGAAAMASSAAAIALAGGMRIVPAFALSGIIVARAIPSIVYVRTLLARLRRTGFSPSMGGLKPALRTASWPALALHAIAILLVALFAKPLAVIAMVLLFARATWQLARQVPPPAKSIGWTEVVVGTVFVGMVIGSFATNAL